VNFFGQKMEKGGSIFSQSKGNIVADKKYLKDH